MRRFSKVEWLLIGLMTGLIPLGASFMLRYTRHAARNDCIEKYSLTSPSLDCDSYADNVARLHALDAALSDAVDLDRTEGKAVRISVWVRDLETKQWAAVNENDTYAPASLMKVPLMIAYYKISEIDPQVLDEKILDDQTLDENTEEYYATSTALVPGKTYSVRALLEQMITVSDNNAAQLLLSHMNQTFFYQTLVDLGIQIPTGTQAIDFITAKTYANIFRILYNASYLSRDLSQQALALMSSSTFDGIAHSVPVGVPVADKFGERTYVESGEVVHELHDCGIVYAAPDPYSICIMTEGRDFNALLSVVQALSLLTYKTLAP